MAIGIGISAWVWTSPLNDQALHLLKKAKQMGFDCFELPLEDPAQFTYEKVDAAIKESGIRPTLCGVWGPDRDMSADDEQLRKNSLNYIHAAVKLCQRWGCRVLPGPMYSAVGKRRYTTAEQKKTEWDLSVKGLREAAKMAADHGVTLALEALNRFEIDMINTIDQCVRLIRDVDRPNVGILFDTFHANIEEKNLYQAVKLAGKLIAHVHANENDRGTPGTGQVRWDELAKGLKEVGYAGDAVIESFTPELKTIAAAAAIWRPLARTQDELATEGLKFLKRLLA